MITNKSIKRYIRRFIIVFYILSVTNFLGLLDAESTTIIIPIKDYGLLLLIFYMISIFPANKLRKLHFLKPLYFLILYIIIIIITMPLRGEINIINSFKTGRLFLGLLFSFIVFDELRVSKNDYWIRKIVFFMSFYYAGIIFLNVIAPSFVSNFFVAGDSYETVGSWGLETTSRFVVKANAGILFVHIGFIIKFYDYFVGKSKSKRNLVLLLVLFSAMVLQGWRAPLFAVIAFTLLFYIVSNKFTHVIKLSGVILLAIVILFSVENYTNNTFFSGKVISAYNELTGESSGTLEGRLNRAKIYQIPMFLKSKWFGHGFVHKNSNMSTSLNNTGERPYNLYDFDFGYISLLNYFGIIGISIFLGVFIYIALNSYKTIKKYGVNLWMQLLLTWIVTLLAINYSFGGFVSHIGLLPLSLTIGIGQWQALNIKNEK